MTGNRAGRKTTAPLFRVDECIGVVHIIGEAYRHTRRGTTRWYYPTRCDRCNGTMARSQDCLLALRSRDAGPPTKCRSCRDRISVWPNADTEHDFAYIRLPYQQEDLYLATNS